jgi:hypothetical protein
VNFLQGVRSSGETGINGPLLKGLQHRLVYLVLLGDTPYIDTTDLARQRKRYGEFFSQPGMAEWLSSTPLAAVWDDHDFGLNDTDGRLKGKERSLQAFREWHANASFGTGTEGVYHRLAPVIILFSDIANDERE